MDFVDASRLIIGLLALACLWMGRTAWLAASNDPLPRRAVGPLIWSAAAAVMVYALVTA